MCSCFFYSSSHFVGTPILKVGFEGSTLRSKNAPQCLVSKVVYLTIPLKSWKPTWKQKKHTLVTSSAINFDMTCLQIQDLLLFKMHIGTTNPFPNLSELQFTNSVVGETVKPATSRGVKIPGYSCRFHTPTKQLVISGCYWSLYNTKLQSKWPWSTVGVPYKFFKHHWKKGVI